MIDIVKVDKGLYLQKISFNDADEVFGLIDANRETLGKWLPFVKMTISVKNTLAFIEDIQKCYSRELVFTITYQGKIAGLIGFKDIDRANRKFEIGYWITSENEGKGIVTRSCAACINLAFDKMKMNRVQIKCGVGNIKSINIPMRLNFHFEGIERAGELHNNKFIDLEVYSMLKTDWGGEDGRG
jgi:ribosomal-protein-serine acetyltransferase